MGCMNHISPSENMFKTAPGAKFRGVEKLAWDSWCPSEFFLHGTSSNDVYTWYKRLERTTFPHGTTRGNQIISTIPQGSHSCFAGWILKADVDPGVETHQSIIYVLKHCLNNSVSSDRSHQVCQKDRTTRNLSYLDFDCLRWCLVLSNFSARKREDHQKPHGTTTGCFRLRAGCSLSPSPANILDNNIIIHVKSSK